MSKILGRFIFIFTLLSLFTNSFAAVAETTLMGKAQLEAVALKYNAQVIDHAYMSKLFIKASPSREAEFKQFQIEYPAIKDLKLPKIQVEDKFIYFFVGKEKVRMTYEEKGFFEVFYKNKIVKLSANNPLMENYKVLNTAFGEMATTSLFSFFIGEAHAVVAGITGLVDAFIAICFATVVFHALGSAASKNRIAKELTNEAINVCNFINHKKIHGKVNIEASRVAFPKAYEAHCTGKNVMNVRSEVCVELQNAMNCMENYKPDHIMDRKRGEIKEQTEESKQDASRANGVSR